ncbi:MAG: serine/threonine-protein kinase, partial [Planctomycetota bacterium]
GARERFLREARAAASIVHANVVTIHAVSDEPPLPWLVMEYVQGNSLQHRLDSSKKLSLTNVIGIGRQIAAALAAAHEKGLVHRDVKPGNVLLNSETGKAQLGDFGLARAAEHSRLTSSGMLVGTPAYLAPEVVEQPDVADHRADLFSLGAVLYAMCSGDSPFQSDTLLATLRKLSIELPQPLSEVCPDVPVWLSQIVMKLLEKNPNDRFQSALEVRKALGDGIGGTTLAPTRQRSTKPKKMLLAVLTLVTVLGLVIGIAWRLSPDRANSSSKQPNNSSDRTAAIVSVEQPYRVLKNGQVATFGNLSDAIGAAGAGSIIEINQSGTINLPQLTFAQSESNQSEPVILKSGRDYQPILVFEPDLTVDSDSLLNILGNVEIQGLELRLPPIPAAHNSSLVRVAPGGNFLLVDCVAFVEDEGSCVKTEGNCTIENSELCAPESFCLRIAEDRNVKADLNNCWLSGNAGFELPATDSVDISLSECTVLCGTNFVVHNENSVTQTAKIVVLSSLLFASESHMDIVDQQFRKNEVVSWTGKRNVYSGNLFTEMVTESPSEKNGRSQLEKWKSLVNETESRFVLSPFETDLERLHNMLSDPDFRISTLKKNDSVKVGANSAD